MHLAGSGKQTDENNSVPDFFVCDWGKKIVFALWQQKINTIFATAK